MVQASHAAHESGLAHTSSPDTHSIIIFGAENKKSLELLYSRFRSQIPCFPFYEPYKNTGLTAFATSPIGNEERHIFKEFKLWKPIFNQHQEGVI